MTTTHPAIVLPTIVPIVPGVVVTVVVAGSAVVPDGRAPLPHEVRDAQCSSSAQQIEPQASGHSCASLRSCWRRRRGGSRDMCIAACGAGNKYALFADPRSAFMYSPQHTYAGVFAQDSVLGRQ